MGTPIPPFEIEWTVATTFNHAIDYYASSEEAACRAWADKAMELAECEGEEGTLAETLRGRFAQLRFENEKFAMLDG